nr:hypothetical protein [Tanacetum cinerariifolium]
MKDMLYFSLSDNKLSGVIPQDLRSLYKLLALDLSKNTLTGPIPRYISDWTQIMYLNLSHNKLTKKITSEIGKLSYLAILDLSWNLHTNKIPSAFHSLVDLEIMNLSHNSLSGSIPKNFAYLPSQIDINLSYNELVGLVPPYRIFSNVSIEVFQGNPDEPSVEAGDDFFSISSFDGRAVHDEIVKATNDFHDAYCIGTGEYGVVYKAKLQPYNIVAVKKLHSVSEKVDHAKFLNEVRALSNIRHQYIVKLYRYCFHARHSFFIYEYLEKGSLKSVFSADIIAKELDWLKRVNIVRAIANGLSYMHHDCSPPIIHRDTSGANILLDANYEAHIYGCNEEKGDVSDIEYGVVYKAKLQPYNIVAVKKLHSVSEKVDHAKFLNEVRALSNIRHQYIVKLYRYCFHARHSFFIYEYLEKGSLKSVFSADIIAKELDWLKRVNIVRAIANGLSYMHHDCSPPIIHRDTSGANILLDANYEAHIYGCNEEKGDVSDIGSKEREAEKENNHGWTWVIDVFIVGKRNKQGKRFGFSRFKDLVVVIIEPPLTIPPKTTTKTSTPKVTPTLKVTPTTMNGMSNANILEGRSDHSQLFCNRGIMNFELTNASHGSPYLDDWITNSIMALQTVLMHSRKVGQSDHTIGMDLDSLFNTYLFESSSDDEDYSPDNNSKGDSNDEADGNHGKGETEDDSGNDSDSGDGCGTETNLNSISKVDLNTDNVGKCNATDAHTGIHFEEGSTSLIRHGVNDKLIDITLAEISSSYVRDTMTLGRSSSVPVDNSKVKVDGSVSHEVDNTILVGNQIDFNMNEVFGRTTKRAGLKDCVSNTSSFDFVCKNSIGKSGGILAVWDTSCFSLIDSLEGSGFLALLENWCNIQSSCLIIVVYASQDYREKKKLWKFESERMGTIFDPRGAAKFNDFITIADLCDLPMGGKRRLSSHVFALPREFSDHTPLLLKNSTVDYVNGPPLDDIQFLDCSFTTLVIKEAVWDFGIAKSPGPDGFTFKFFKKHWDIVEHDVVSYVKDFKVSAHIPKGCNSSFITLVPKVEDPLTIGDFRPISLIGCQYKIIAKILARCLSRVVSSVIGDVQMAFIKSRQIIDGPLVVDEIIAWAKKYKRRLMFLKVDFEKAFNSLSWSFLFSILEQMGFSSKWRRDLFHGVKVGKEKFHISHLHFANDALKMDEWSLTNALNLSTILTCFHLASGLKVDFSKSELFGIGVSNVELYSIASSMGCLVSYFPCNNWKPLVDKFHERLSKWKSKSLSIGRRVTLIKPGGKNDENKIAWIALEKVISPRVNGGLGIGSLRITNQVLLVKWWWRFCVEDQALWCKVIRSIHGPSGGLVVNTTKKYKSGSWYYIKKLKDVFQRNGINLPSMFKKKVGNGQGTSFWNDIYLGGLTLLSSFPRLYRLDANPSCLVSEIIPTASSLSSPIVNSVMGLSSPLGLIFRWAWRRDIRIGHKLKELNNLNNLLA